MELIDVVDENNELTGQIEDRMVAYKKGLWRRTVSCWIMNEKGEILLQKRTANKLRNPNKWSKTGGQVDSGESVEDAIFREVKEELGIEIPKEQIKVLECWKSKGSESKRFAYNFIFIVNYKIDDYKLQKEEVSEVKYVTIEEMEQIKDNKDSNYTFCNWDDEDFYREMELLRQKRKEILNRDKTMEKYYEQLNAKCKEVAKVAIKDNSILSDNMLKKEERELLLSDWNAFLIGLISDQSVKAEIAWRLPYYLSERLGHFDFYRIVKEETVESLENIIKEKPALHRYPRKMAEYIFFAVNKIVNDYNSNCENIWKNDLDAEHVVAKLEEFKGISHKKAALGTLLLVRDFSVTLENLYCIDIAYDVHIRRIFLRMGLTDKDNIKDVTSSARQICGEFTGSLTLPFWVAGREYCRPTNPKCEECYLEQFCKKRIELGKDL